MDLKYNLGWKLKNVSLIRSLCKPWMDRKLQRIHQEYLLSEHPHEIQSLKNICQGKRCFIIGNGPSLLARDLDQLKNEYTFAANRVYEIFSQTDWRPWAYMVVDRDYMWSDAENIKKVPCEWKFIPFEAKMDTHEWKHTFQIHGGITNFVIHRGNDITAYIPEDVSKGFSNGYTVTFIAIQLAIYMGFREIYLLGVDFNYSVYYDKNGKVHHRDGVTDYFNGKKYVMTMQMMEPTRQAYIVSRQYCDSHEIIIKNATRGGKLEVFERVDFNSLF